MSKKSSAQALRIRHGFIFVSLCLCGLLQLSCGYHVAGRGSALPAGWSTISVPAFENRTPRYRLEQTLTQAVVRELIARTKYRVVSDPAAGDAVLRGEVISIDSSAVLFDNSTGRATTMLVTVRMKARLEERATKKVIWRNDNFLFREEYEISTDIPSFFQEQDPALKRMAQEFAATLVSALLENF